MPSDSSVIADPASGAAIVAGTRVAMSAAADGAFRFGGPGGSVLRPLTFGERTELVSAASAMPAARDAVAAAILAAATLERGAGATFLMETLAMWLAGAAFDGPDFMETTLLVARAAGWPPHELFMAPAREVDRLAVHLDEQRRASEWKSLVFAEAPAETIEAVRARFADRLLRRSAAAGEARAEEERAEMRSLAGRAMGAAELAGIPRGARAAARDAAASAGGDAGVPDVGMAPHAAVTAGGHAGVPDVGTGRDAGVPDVGTVRGAVVLGGGDAGVANVGTARNAVALAGGDVGVADVRTARGAGVANVAMPPAASTGSLRGARVIAPRAVVRDRVAAGEQRPALAFSIRQPGPGASRSVSEIAQSTAVASTVAVVREESEILRLEPKRETRFHEHDEDVAATLAALLDDEADLRGVER